MEADAIQKKLDCYILTAKISKINANQITAKGKVGCNNELSKSTLARISDIKRLDERLLTRLDYWIYGQLSSDLSGDVSCRTVANVSDTLQTWEFNLKSTEKTDEAKSSDTLGIRESQVTRSLSSVKPRSAEPKRSKPWRKGVGRKEPESISMFAYNIKSGIDDDSLSTGAILRKHMASKFGTLNKRRLKMFFTKDKEDENSDAKSRKSVKSQPNLDAKSASVKPKALFKLMKRGQKHSLAESPEVDDNFIGLRKKAGTRPKSMVSCDFDFDDITITTKSSSDRDSNLPEDEESKRKTFRERLKSMPIFYIPSSKKDRIKIFK